MSEGLSTFADVEAARNRIAGSALRTPLVSLDSEVAGGPPSSPERQVDFINGHRFKHSPARTRVARSKSRLSLESTRTASVPLTVLQPRPARLS